MIPNTPLDKLTIFYYTIINKPAGPLISAMILRVFGRVLFCMNDKENFKKPFLTYEQQADLLLSRGLECVDRTKLIQSLQHYNYYRLSGYCLAFEQQRHKFLPGVTFEDLADSYEFDRKLRKILMESLELIEIQLRTSIAYYLAQTYGAFGHENINNLHISEDDFNKWQNLIHGLAEDSKEIFIKHFKNKYAEFPSLPIWILVEILPFGSLSYLFSSLKNEDKKAIAKLFNIPATVLSNWLHVFSHIRNICAHHNRLFDRTLSIGARRLFGTLEDFPTNKIVFAIIAIRTVLKSSCFPQFIVNNWMNKIEDLFSKKPNIKNFYQLVGSPVEDKWFDNQFWK